MSLGLNLTTYTITSVNEGVSGIDSWSGGSSASLKLTSVQKYNTPGTEPIEAGDVLLILCEIFSTSTDAESTPRPTSATGTLNQIVRLEYRTDTKYYFGRYLIVVTAIGSYVTIASGSSKHQVHISGYVRIAKTTV